MLFSGIYFCKNEAWQFEMHFFYVTFHFFYPAHTFEDLEINSYFWPSESNLFVLTLPTPPGTLYCDLFLFAPNSELVLATSLSTVKDSWDSYDLLTKTFHPIEFPLGAFFLIFLECHLLCCLWLALIILNS